MTRSDFREKWGSPWAALVASPMWQDALVIAEEELRVFKINGLTDDQIEAHGHLTLKAMQGHTRLENTLATLADKPFEFTALVEDYPDAVKEAHDLANPPAAPKCRKKKTP